MQLYVKTAGEGYNITIERGALLRSGEYFNLNRRVMIVTDDGVPAHYAESVAQQCAFPTIVTIKQGEKTKNSETLMLLLKRAIEAGLTRTDCIVAVGGGVVGDLSGFAAACYMRGIDFYNIPTTVLSQIDSSIGGKTAVDFEGYKNLIGAFWQPRGVIIDSQVLATLPKRHISNGLAEAVKMALTSDPELFEIFERDNYLEYTDTITERSVKIKRDIVEADEKENGLRKILNFGHTLAHAIESVNGMEKYYHGEAVAAGMVPMCAAQVRERLLPVLNRLKLPTSFFEDTPQLIEAVRHDKKCSGNMITVVRVPKIGSYELCEISVEQLKSEIEGAAEL